MKQFKDIKVGTKLVGLVAVMGVLLLVSVLVSMNTVEQVNNSYQQIQREDDYAGQLGISIGKAFSEQKLALEQIDQGVMQVSQVVQANSATSEQAASASQQLSAQAERLQETASRFRLAQGGTFPTPAATIQKPQLPARPQAVGKVPPKIALTPEEGFGKY